MLFNGYTKAERKAAQQLLSANGHCDVLDYLESVRPDLRCDNEAALRAASNNHFNVIEWLERRQPELAVCLVLDARERMVKHLTELADENEIIALLFDGLEYDDDDNINDDYDLEKKDSEAEI